MPKRAIYLVRHGQYESKPDDGELGGSLTELGQHQAQMVGDMLSTFDISAIHCSSMRRAEETAQIIAKSFPNIEPNSTKLLWELVPTIPPHLEDYFETLAVKNPQFSIKEVELKREYADEAFEKFFRPAGIESDSIVIVCHGNLIRYLVCQALGINPDKWSNMYINHCSLTVIEVEPSGTMILVSYNETGHLPKHMKTER